MFTFLHAADIHLDSPLQKLERYEGAPVDDLRQATRRALERMVNLAIAKRVNFVLISGDLYDGNWKDYNTGLYFVLQMKKLCEAGISVYLVSGNHDAANKMTKALKLPEGIHLFSYDQPETILLDQFGVAVHGLSFATPSVWQDLSVKYPPGVPGYFNIGMLHTCCLGSEGHDPYAPCTIDGLRLKAYDYWALGHIHKRETLYKDPIIAFPGNIQGRHIRETGAKGCLLITVNDDGEAGLDFQPLDVIRWMRCEIEALAADKGYDIVDQLSGKLAKLLDRSDGLPVVARIEVTGASCAHEELAADPERWANEIRSAAIDASGGRIWVEKVNLRTTLPSQYTLDEINHGPIGELLAIFDELKLHPDQLQAMGEPLKDLWKKLPREIKDDQQAMSPENAMWLSGLLDQVKPMLLQRLISQGK